MRGAHWRCRPIGPHLAVARSLTTPLNTLPHDELMTKLKSLTNLRVVRDQDSATGWTLTHEPFPGWETVPVW